MAKEKLVTSEVREFIIGHLESIQNDTELAHLCLDKFKLKVKFDNFRRSVNSLRKQNRPRTVSTPKRLFFDIETSPCLGWFWRPSFNTNILPHQVIEDAKIICISYKWEGEDKIHNLNWSQDQCDKKMLQDFVKVLNKADEIIGHNSDRFDEKWLRTRAVFHRIPMLPKYRSLDTLKKARSGFNFPSNKLDEIGKYLGVGRKIENEKDLWGKVWRMNDRKALKRMVKYCDQDVILLEDVFFVMNSYIFNNNNFTVLKGGDKWQCPDCSSVHTELIKVQTTAAGTVKRLMECNSCEKNYFINTTSYTDFLQFKMNFNQND